jgi:hypothetical protein
LIGFASLRRPHARWWSRSATPPKAAGRRCPTSGGRSRPGGVPPRWSGRVPGKRQARVPSQPRKSSASEKTGALRPSRSHVRTSVSVLTPCPRASTRKPSLGSPCQADEHDVPSPDQAFLPPLLEEHDAVDMSSVWDGRRGRWPGTTSERTSRWGARGVHALGAGGPPGTDRDRARGGRRFHVVTLRMRASRSAMSSSAGPPGTMVSTTAAQRSSRFAAGRASAVRRRSRP